MTPVPPDKPRLRGVSHQLFFFVAVIAGVLLVRAAPSGRATWAAAVYASSLALLLGVSAVYHRVTWRPRPRAWMRRFDHSAIFILIAGTYTPLCVALPARANTALLLVWTAAAMGTLKSMLWPHAPKWLVALLCVGMGWGGMYLTPTIEARAGFVGLMMVVAGGLLYSVGAVIYALKRPDPAPRVFGYHEIFHALVVVAASLHFAVIVQVVEGL